MRIIIDIIELWSNFAEYIEKWVFKKIVCYG